MSFWIPEGKFSSFSFIYYLVSAERVVDVFFFFIYLIWVTIT